MTRKKIYLTKLHLGFAVLVAILFLGSAQATASEAAVRVTPEELEDAITRIEEEGDPYLSGMNSSLSRIDQLKKDQEKFLAQPRNKFFGNDDAYQKRVAEARMEVSRTTAEIALVNDMKDLYKKHEGYKAALEQKLGSSPDSPTAMADKEVTRWAYARAKSQMEASFLATHGEYTGQYGRAHASLTTPEQAEYNRAYAEKTYARVSNLYTQVENQEKKTIMDGALNNMMQDLFKVQLARAESEVKLELARARAQGISDAVLISDLEESLKKQLVAEKKLQERVAQKAQANLIAQKYEPALKAKDQEIKLLRKAMQEAAAKKTRVMVAGAEISKEEELRTQWEIAQQEKALMVFESQIEMDPSSKTIVEEGVDRIKKYIDRLNREFKEFVDGEKKQQAQGQKDLIFGQFKERVGAAKESHMAELDKALGDIVKDLNKAKEAHGIPRSYWNASNDSDSFHADIQLLANQRSQIASNRTKLQYETEIKLFEEQDRIYGQGKGPYKGYNGTGRIEYERAKEGLKTMQDRLAKLEEEASAIEAQLDKTTEPSGEPNEEESPPQDSGATVIAQPGDSSSGSDDPFDGLGDFDTRNRLGGTLGQNRGEMGDIFRGGEDPGRGKAQSGDAYPQREDIIIDGKSFPFVVDKPGAVPRYDPPNYMRQPDVEYKGFIFESIVRDIALPEGIAPPPGKKLPTRIVHDLISFVRVDHNTQTAELIKVGYGKNKKGYLSGDTPTPLYYRAALTGKFVPLQDGFVQPQIPDKPPVSTPIITDKLPKDPEMRELALRSKAFSNDPTIVEARFPMGGMHTGKVEERSYAVIEDGKVLEVARKDMTYKDRSAMQPDSYTEEYKSADGTVVKLVQKIDIEYKDGEEHSYKEISTVPEGDEGNVRRTLRVVEEGQEIANAPTLLDKEGNEIGQAKDSEHRGTEHEKKAALAALRSINKSIQKDASASPGSMKKIAHKTFKEGMARLAEQFAKIDRSREQSAKQIEQNQALQQRRPQEGQERRKKEEGMQMHGAGQR